MDYKAFHKLTYGLYVIATDYNRHKAGYIANTVFQVTSSPQQIAISCHKNNDTLQYLLKSRIFSVSVLKQETDPALIGNFGFKTGSETDKFAQINYETRITGAPVITGSSVAWLDCRVVNTIDLGSHVLLVGEVADCGILSDEEPLTYQVYREKYKMLSPKNAPTYIEKEKLSAEANVQPADTPQGQESAILSDDMDPYICEICGHVYYPEDGDPSAGILPGTPFGLLPEDYRCPVCNAEKDNFKPL